MSCSVKVYFALKLAGDSPGGAAHAAGACGNSRARWRSSSQRVHAHHAWRCLRRSPGAAVPYIRSKSCSCRRCVPLSSRQSVLLVADGDGAAFHSVHAQARARNPRNVHPRVVYGRHPKRSATIFGRPAYGLAFLARVFRGSIASAVCSIRRFPQPCAMRATRRAEAWMIERVERRQRARRHLSRPWSMRSKALAVLG